MCYCVILQDLSDEQGAEVVREGFRQGINFYDTSPYYGVTRSETVWLLLAFLSADLADNADVLS